MNFDTRAFMNPHWLTIFSVIFTCLITVAYWYFVLPMTKAKWASIVTAFIAAIMITLSLLKVALVPLFILLLWVIPALLVWFNKDTFKGLDQRPIVALQIFRFLGLVFIFEMFRDRIPGTFAWPAGVGDVIVAATALTLVLAYKKIPQWGAILVITIGLLDFAVALFFGITTQEGPLQLFEKGFTNQLGTFPTGLIPLFLVPYAIVFHMLSWINLKKD